ncbi:MAG: hypothetical protein HOV67_17710, partial [Kribbellaceae bacterium]|nr:hypothetical protein [Kribbellaceae bacterium]
GTIALDKAKPSSGSYQDVDGMGLFWSMDPPDGDPDAQFFVPPAEAGLPVAHVTISVSRGHDQLASTTITRRWLTPGVTIRELTTAKDKLTGRYVAPPADGRKHPAVLFLGGSEGGVSSSGSVALLAAHGYPVLTLGYFHAPGRPADLRDIPIEYFASAATWLSRQPDVDAAHIVVMGTSYGSQPALLLADHFPSLVHGVVLFAPGNKVIGSFPHQGGAAWTYQGKPLQPDEEIPVDGIDGPVLAVAGTADVTWESQFAARSIMRGLDAAHDKYPHKAVIVDGAGHGVGGAPYLPHGTTMQHPIVGTFPLGGSRPADESALLQGWTQTLALLASLGH